MSFVDNDVGQGFGWVGPNSVGNGLLNILMAPDIVPGADPSYQLCKDIFIYHPVGKKMAQKPINVAMSKRRKIAVPSGPEERCIEKFNEEWDALNADENIFNTMRQARVYGDATIGILANDVLASEVINPFDLPKLSITFNVWDPLNTAGSLVLNQDPNAIDFQKHKGVAVSGRPYDRSRTVTMFNEPPLYIAYNPAAFGFVGFSSYQSALFPLKSFIYSMIADAMVARKAGLLVAKIKTAGSIIDNVMAAVGVIKRAMLKLGATDNVLEIGHEDAIETLDMMNADKALQTPRKNILNNIAAAADMPAIMLNEETFADGWADGSEDAEEYIRYVNRIRGQMQPLYTFFDNIVMHRAWNEDFFKTIQAEFSDYKLLTYNEAFYRWKNSFRAVWPKLREEPESKQVEVDDVKLKGMIATLEVLLPAMDPENKATTIQWFADNINENKLMFTTPLELDLDALKAYVPPTAMEEPDAPPAFSSRA